MGSFEAKVQGVTARNENGISRQAYIARYCRAGTPVSLVRESRHPQDDRTVAVYVKARKLFLFPTRVRIGYLPPDVAGAIAPYMDRARSVQAWVSEITGDWAHRRARGVNLQISYR